MSAALATMLVTTCYWTASHTSYTSETSEFYETVSASIGSRRGRTVQLIDTQGLPVDVSFGPRVPGDAGLEEGDRIHILCKGFDSYCRVVDWREI